MLESVSHRQHSIPVLYTRGTHFEVGLDIGRTFSSMIKEFLQIHTGLNQTLLKDYATPFGKKLYEESFATVRASFPQYISELEGIAKGAGVDFSKLFLLHLGDLLPNYVGMASERRPLDSLKSEAKSDLKLQTIEQPSISPTTATGCLNIVVNNFHNRYIAHTQDGTFDVLNHVYFVVAHIINNEPQGKYQVKEEKFMSLCYAGLLPGFSMSSNHHGLVFAVNKLTPSTVGISKTPPHFLGRALLSAETVEKAVIILNDEGVGAADGFSLSIASINDRLRKCYIIEVAPAILGAKNSLLNIGEVQAGSYSYHANKYLGLDVYEVPNEYQQSSDARLEAVASYAPPRTRQRVVDILNDEKIFLIGGSDRQQIRTIVVGIFDLNEKNLAVYIDRPNEGEPMFVMPLDLNSDCRIFEK